MYNSFTCADLTANYSSADGGVDVLKQIDDLNARLRALQSEAKTVRAKYDSLSWVESSSVKRGYHGVPKGTYRGNWMNDCEGSFCYSVDSEKQYTKAKTDRTAAKSRIDSIQAEVDSIMKQLDQLGSTNPNVIKAKAEAEATAKSIEQTTAAKTSVYKTIGYVAAGLLIVGGIVWAVVKLRKARKG